MKPSAVNGSSAAASAYSGGASVHQHGPAEHHRQHREDADQAEVGEQLAAGRLLSVLLLERVPHRRLAQRAHPHPEALREEGDDEAEARGERVDAELVVVQEARQQEDVRVLDQPERHHDRGAVAARDDDLLDLAEVQVRLEAARQQDQGDHAGHRRPDQRADERPLHPGAAGEQDREDGEAQQRPRGVGDQVRPRAALEPEDDVGDLEHQQDAAQQAGEGDDPLVLGVAQQAVGDRLAEDVDERRPERPEDERPHEARAQGPRR